MIIGDSKTTCKKILSTQTILLMCQKPLKNAMRNPRKKVLVAMGIVSVKAGAEFRLDRDKIA